MRFAETYAAQIHAMKTMCKHHRVLMTKNTGIVLKKLSCFVSYRLLRSKIKRMKSVKVILT